MLERQHHGISSKASGRHRLGQPRREYVCHRRQEHQDRTTKVLWRSNARHRLVGFDAFSAGLPFCLGLIVFALPPFPSLFWEEMFTLCIRTPLLIFYRCSQLQCYLESQKRLWTFEHC